MRLLARSIAFALLCSVATAQAAPWTYRGTLNDGGAPANGRYEFRLSLFDASGAKSLAYPLTVSGVEVKNGAFAIDVDFGMDLTRFGALKLKTEVAQGGSGFVPLGEPRVFDAKAALGSVCWDTQGNAGTNDATDFLGTTDGEELILKVGNAQIMRFDYPANIIGGSSANGMDTFGGTSQTIAGGGSAAMNCGDELNLSCAQSVVADYGSIGGGGGNYVSGTFGTIGGGDANDVTAKATTVAGGQVNRASAQYASVGGGLGNVASGSHAVVAGGEFNRASGGYSGVFSGQANSATGIHSAAGSGYNNCAGGDRSLALGTSASIRRGSEPGDGTCGTSSGDANGDEGSFVWSDATTLNEFTTSGPNQFLIRAGGGFHLNDSTPASGNDDVTLATRVGSGDADFDLRLVTRSGKEYLAYVIDSSGTLLFNPISLTSGSSRLSVGGGAGGTASLSHGGMWTNASSRTYKENIAPVDGESVLRKLVALPISEWQYKGSTEGTHLGPMAEDFKAAFGLAGDGKSIGTADADGVALVAIQGLNAKLEAELQQSHAQNAQLQTRLELLASRLAALEAAKEH